MFISNSLILQNQKTEWFYVSSLLQISTNSYDSTSDGIGIFNICRHKYQKNSCENEKSKSYRFIVFFIFFYVTCPEILHIFQYFIRRIVRLLLCSAHTQMRYIHASRVRRSNELTYTRVRQQKLIIKKLISYGIFLNIWLVERMIRSFMDV